MNYQMSFLKDYPFLKKIDLENLMTFFIKVIVLNREELPIEEIQGRITSGNINIDGSSAMRRTASLSFLADESSTNLDNVDSLLSINKKIQILVGIENNVDTNYDNIIWFKQGVFVITEPSITHSAAGVIISLSCKDKMCLLNGEFGGVLPTSITFDEYDSIDDDGNITSNKQLIFDIIQTVVCNYGNEAISKIFINDIDLEIKQIIRYVGSNTLYYNTVNSMYTNDFSLVDETSSTWLTFEYNEDIGYIYTDFVYPGELISNVGENVVSVLDKIKEVLGNYEYFYDVDGNFVFQEIKNYLNNSYDATTTYRLDNGRKVELDQNNLSIIDDSNYIIDFNSNSQSTYTFNEDTGLVTSFTNVPLYSNIKNDFHIWGSNEDGRIIHYHLAIKEKPSIMNSYQVVYYTDEAGDYNGKLRLAASTEDGEEYIPEDWRAELYLQGLSEKAMQQRPDIYKQEILDLFDNIYNMKEKQFKTDIVEHPNSLKYFIDYLEPVAALSDCSVDALSTKIYPYEKESINKLYNSDIPDIILVDVSAEDEDREETITRCEAEGQPYSNVAETIYSNTAIGTTGYSAQETLRVLLYQYTNYNETITIQSKPIYYLQVNSRITVYDKKSNIHGDYIIKSISLPLDARNQMSITATKALRRI